MARFPGHPRPDPAQPGHRRLLHRTRPGPGRRGRRPLVRRRRLPGLSKLATARSRRRLPGGPRADGRAGPRHHRPCLQRRDRRPGVDAALTPGHGQFFKAFHVRADREPSPDQTDPSRWPLPPAEARNPHTRPIQRRCGTKRRPGRLFVTQRCWVWDEAASRAAVRPTVTRFGRTVGIFGERRRTVAAPILTNHTRVVLGRQKGKRDLPYSRDSAIAVRCRVNPARQPTAGLCVAQLHSARKV